MSLVSTTMVLTRKVNLDSPTYKMSKVYQFYLDLARTQRFNFIFWICISLNLNKVHYWYGSVFSLICINFVERKRPNVKMSKTILVTFAYTTLTCKCKVRIRLQIINTILAKKCANAALKPLMLVFSFAFFYFRRYFSSYQTHIIRFIT